MNPLVLVDHIPVLPEALLLVGACVVMIVVAKAMALLLRRPDTYYPEPDD